MLYSRSDIIQKIHLIISVGIVVPMAILYGFFPDALLELLPDTNDEHSFFKAVMGIYLAFATIWVFGILKSSLLRTALITNVAFMLGLGLGRVMSMILDGVPSPGFAFGTAGELFLGIYGVWVLKRMKV